MNKRRNSEDYRNKLSAISINSRELTEADVLMEKKEGKGFEVVMDSSELNPNNPSNKDNHPIVIDGRINRRTLKFRDSGNEIRISSRPRIDTSKDKYDTNATPANTKAIFNQKPQSTICKSNSLQRRIPPTDLSTTNTTAISSNDNVIQSKDLNSSPYKGLDTPKKIIDRTSNVMQSVEQKMNKITYSLPERPIKKAELMECVGGRKSLEYVVSSDSKVVINTKPSPIKPQHTDLESKKDPNTEITHQLHELIKPEIKVIREPRRLSITKESNLCKINAFSPNDPDKSTYTKKDIMESKILGRESKPSSFLQASTTANYPNALMEDNTRVISGNQAIIPTESSMSLKPGSQITTNTIITKEDHHHAETLSSPNQRNQEYDITNQANKTIYESQDLMNMIPRARNHPLPEQNKPEALTKSIPKEPNTEAVTKVNKWQRNRPMSPNIKTNDDLINSIKTPLKALNKGFEETLVIIEEQSKEKASSDQLPITFDPANTRDNTQENTSNQVKICTNKPLNLADNPSIALDDNQSRIHYGDITNVGILEQSIPFSTQIFIDVNQSEIQKSFLKDIKALREMQKEAMMKIKANDARNALLSNPIKYEPNFVPNDNPSMLMNSNISLPGESRLTLIPKQEFESMNNYFKY